ncbi:type 2 periplasmic-binding domain-containing protein [Musicola paradisiaca]|uniref:hypothetical protein n=1 Tax=Musicola paradisiaca TaxID=69223 RepID=UPI0012936E33|nr:hypothetical protein [Musicola paradisiaca]
MFCGVQGWEPSWFGLGVTRYHGGRVQFLDAVQIVQPMLTRRRGLGVRHPDVDIGDGVHAADEGLQRRDPDKGAIGRRTVQPDNDDVVTFQLPPAAGKRLIALFPDAEPTALSVYAVYRSREHMSAALRALLDFLVAWFAANLEWKRLSQR